MTDDQFDKLEKVLNNISIGINIIVFCAIICTIVFIFEVFVF
jgi:hypothetical protein